jgi:hypothetical protein
MEVWLCYFILKQQVWTRITHVRGEKCVLQMSRMLCTENAIRTTKKYTGRYYEIGCGLNSSDSEWIQCKIQNCCVSSTRDIQKISGKKNPSCPCVRRTVQYSSHGIPEILRRFTAPHNLNPSCQLTPADFKLGAHIFKNMVGVWCMLTIFLYTKNIYGYGAERWAL